MTDLLTLPASEVLAGTTRVGALEAAGFRLDTTALGNVRVYERGETAHGLDRSPRCSAYCVLRRVDAAR